MSEISWLDQDPFRIASCSLFDAGQAGFCPVKSDLTLALGVKHPLPGNAFVQQKAQDSIHRPNRADERPASLRLTGPTPDDDDDVAATLGAADASRGSSELRRRFIQREFSASPKRSILRRFKSLPALESAMERVREIG